jgi:hypothetical protein
MEKGLRYQSAIKMKNPLRSARYPAKSTTFDDARP